MDKVNKQISNILFTLERFSNEFCTLVSYAPVYYKMMDNSQSKQGKLPKNKSENNQLLVEDFEIEIIINGHFNMFRSQYAYLIRFGLTSD